MEVSLFFIQLYILYIKQRETLQRTLRVLNRPYSIYETSKVL